MDLFLVESAAVKIPDVVYVDPDVDLVFEVDFSSSSLSVDHGHHVLVARRFTPPRNTVSLTDDVTLPCVRLKSLAVPSIPARFLCV